jgi:NAD(P)H-hydrate epimerase
LLQTLQLDPACWVLTPHPGEWQRLGGGVDVAPLTPTGFRAAAGLAERLGAALLYKHATPVLVTGNPKAPGFVLTEGSLTLARAGSGDLLAGTIGAHGAIGLDAVVATLRSQVLVARAAELAGGRAGAHAVLASDILNALGRPAARDG